MKLNISYREIWRVAYPIILGSFAQNILNITDTAFLGRVGEIALGGGVLGGLLYHVMLMLGWGMAMGGQIIVARRVGEGANEAVGRVVEHLLFTLGTFAILIMLFAHALYPAFFSIAVRSNLVCNSASSFFGYRLFGLPFAFLTYSLNAFLIGITRTKVITLTSFITVFVNIVLDYGLIFGNFGLPLMGVRGAALASVIAEIAGATFLLVYISRMNVSKYKLFNFSSFSKKLLKSILDISWPLMLQFSLSIFVWFVFFLIIEKMGETPLAVSNIVRSIYIILMIPIWGFASATNSFVSQHIGKGKSDQVVKLVVKVMVITLASVFVLSALILLLGDSIIKIYTNDEHIINATLPVIRVIAIAALTMASAFISFNGVSGTGSTKVSFAIEVFTLTFYLGWAYLIAIILAKSLSLVWTSEVLYGIMVTVISIIYLRTGRWKNRVV
ncbi:MAG: MATE family efflux transporter [Tenuifilum sp.]|uniref:MATE family efflux transporter n=1 Tax=Tenuifilum sp. TaxID=2760880 RepID=UPI0030963081